jgi:DNA-binding response OmpR family regulator
MATPRILSIGCDPALASLRTLILRNAGYAVEEVYSVDRARSLVHSDVIDLTLICHTLPKSDQQVLISFIRDKRQLMPILCIQSYAFESVPRTCVPVDNDPERLLNAVRAATKLP